MSLYLCLGIVIVFTIIIIINQIKRVKENEVYVIERNGKFKKIATSGVTFVIPFLERVKTIVSLNKQTRECYANVAITLDGKVIKYKNTFQFHVIDAYKATYEAEHLETKLEFIETTVFREIVRKIGFGKS